MATLFVLALCELAICTPDPTIAQAEALMDEAEYVEAERALTRGLMRSHLSTVIKTRSYWLLGICYVSLGNLSLAKSSFHKLLLLSPSFEPEKQTSPKILSAFHETKKQFSPYQPKISILEKFVQFSVAESDRTQDIKRVVLYIRRVGNSNFTAVDLSPDIENRHIYTGLIPSHILFQKDESNTMEYYLEALSASQSKLCGIASHELPISLSMKIQESPSPTSIEIPPSTTTVWPYWTAAGTVLLAGLIYATIALATAENNHIRVVVHR